MEDLVVLVDENDRETGTMPKLKAHQEGVLHRAFSIFIFNSHGEMLIHRRAEEKYHTGLLWSNACCSHPLPGEDREVSLQRKLKQEMGFNCPLQYAFTITYRAELANGLTEHELDHVYIGQYDTIPQPNPEEVCDCRYVSIDGLRLEVMEHPDRFTPWFKILFERVVNHYQDIQRD